MHSQNNTTTPPKSSFYRFFSRMYQQLTKSRNNELELGPINLDNQPQLTAYKLPPIDVPLTDHRFSVDNVEATIHSFGTPTNRMSDLTSHTMFPGLLSSHPDRKIMEYIEREIRASRSSNREQAARWWANVGRSRMQSEVAVPLECLNATRLEGYSNLVIPDEFICGISHDIMTNPVYDPAFPKQKYDLLVIREWLKENQTNPCTRTPLSRENLVYDEALKERIDQFVNSILTPRSCQF